MPRVSYPGRDLEAERLQHQRRRFRHLAEAEESDPPLFRANDRGAPPLLPGLCRRVAGHIAMKTKHVHDDVLRHHRIAAWRLDLAERGVGELGMLDKRLDPSRAAEHGFQVREGRKGIEIGMHEGEVFDIRDVAGLGPDADFKVGELFAERVAPCLGVADMFVEIDDKQRQDRLLGHGAVSVVGNPAGCQALPCAPGVVEMPRLGV